MLIWEVNICCIQAARPALQIVPRSGLLFQAMTEWSPLFQELRRLQKESCYTGPDLRWQEPNADYANDFAKWYHQLPERYAQHTLVYYAEENQRVLQHVLHLEMPAVQLPEEYFCMIRQPA